MPAKCRTRSRTASFTAKGFLAIAGSKLMPVGALVERLARSLVQCIPPGEELPAPHDDIDIGGIELEPVTGPAGHLGGDQARPRAEKRVIDRLARSAVVGDRTTHALHGFLRAVPPALLALRVAKRVVVGDLPHRRLGAVALPVAGLAVAHRVPTGFMLPMVIAAAQGEVLLDPDDLRTRLQPA